MQAFVTGVQPTSMDNGILATVLVVAPVAPTIIAAEVGVNSSTRGKQSPAARAREDDVACPWKPEPADAIGLTKGKTMPTIIAHHDVKDAKHWLASSKREEFFGPLGISNIRTFVDPQNPTRVALLIDVPDMDALMAAMQTKGAADAMEHDGVLADTLVILVES